MGTLRKTTEVEMPTFLIQFSVPIGYHCLGLNSFFGQQIQTTVHIHTCQIERDVNLSCPPTSGKSKKSNCKNKDKKKNKSTNTKNV